MEIQPAKAGDGPKPKRTMFEVAKKVGWHAGKAAWILGTSALVLLVPLIIEMDREQQLVEMETQQMGVLQGGAAAPAGGAQAAPAAAAK